mmetsp:Transcript_28910/g.27839  ORF Transcript_28910/g.27839 Transcript_28910/m.27839 type:complete len:99 (-) Transcript_28910:2179-2475(-)
MFLIYVGDEERDDVDVAWDQVLQLSHVLEQELVHSRQNLFNGIFIEILILLFGGAVLLRIHRLSGDLDGQVDVFQQRKQDLAEDFLPEKLRKILGMHL